MGIGVNRVEFPLHNMDETTFSAIAKRLVDFSSNVLREELDEIVDRVLPPPNEAGIDAFGVDRDTARASLAFVAFLHRWYFRTKVFGIEHIPEGKVLLIANHSGQIPLDAIMITASVAMDAKPPRLVRGMVDRFVGSLPFIPLWFSRVGQVLGSPENAKRLLDQGNILLSFPEGVTGISKTFTKRYRLEPFGLGFMRLAIEHQTPIVPVAVIGAEEQLISVADIKPLGRLVGLPVFPVVPQLFLGMPFPLPCKYRIYFGKPLTFSGNPDGDDAVIEKKVGVVRNVIQNMIDQGVAERKAIFW